MKGEKGGEEQWGIVKQGRGRKSNKGDNGGGMMKE